MSRLRILPSRFQYRGAIIPLIGNRYLFRGPVPVVNRFQAGAKLKQPLDSFNEIATCRFMESRYSKRGSQMNIGSCLKELVKNIYVISTACHHQHGEA